MRVTTGFSWKEVEKKATFPGQIICYIRSRQGNGEFRSLQCVFCSCVLSFRTESAQAPPIITVKMVRFPWKEQAISVRIGLNVNADSDLASEVFTDRDPDKKKCCGFNPDPEMAKVGQ